MWWWSASRRALLGAAACAAAGAFLCALWLRVPARRPLPGPPPPSEYSWPTPHRLLPHRYWRHRAEHPRRYGQPTCASPPPPERLQYAAAGWQLLRTADDEHVYIYAAHWDPRFREPLVRVLLYSDATPPPRLVCLLWYADEAAPERVRAAAQYAWRREWGGPTDAVNEPYIVSCGARRHPPAPQRAPRAVSLVLEGHMCGTPTNILNVQGIPSEEDDPHDVTPAIDANVTWSETPPDDISTNTSTNTNTSSTSGARASKEMTFCVCLKWVQFTDDISGPLVEWIEFIKEFGASKLYTFLVQAHPHVQRVLRHYGAEGFADVSPFTHAPQLRGSFGAGARDFHDYRRELLPLNDGLYRARAAGCAWLVAIDSDEIIVPRGNLTTWRQVVAAAGRGARAPDALACRNYYFIDTAQRDLAAPPHLHILGHRVRAARPSPRGYNVKSFHNTASVVAMHNHYPMRCRGGRCRSRDVSEEVARLHHYRARCGGGRAHCSATRHTVRDDTTARYGHVAARVTRVLRRLRILPRD